MSIRISGARRCGIPCRWRRIARIRVIRVTAAGPRERSPGGHLRIPLRSPRLVVIVPCLRVRCWDLGAKRTRRVSCAARRWIGQLSGTLGGSRWRRGSGDGSGVGGRTCGPGVGTGFRGRTGQGLFWSAAVQLMVPSGGAVARGLRRRARADYLLFRTAHRDGRRGADRSFPPGLARRRALRNRGSRHYGLLGRALLSRGTRRRRSVAKRLLAGGAIRWRVRGHGRQTFLLTRNLYYPERDSRLQECQSFPCQLSRRNNSARKAVSSPGRSRHHRGATKNSGGAVPPTRSTTIRGGSNSRKSTDA